MNIKPIIPQNSNIDQTNYYTFGKIFSDEELTWINNLQNLYPLVGATIIGDKSETNLIRKSSIKWIHHDEYSAWLYDKMIDLATKANEKLWDFNLHSVLDSIQYTEYYNDGGHYDWHVDIGPGSINHRKISITVQLSDPEEYEGGDFQLWVGGNFKTLPKSKGDVIIFPSFLMHRITPITKGTRKSLVLWIGGGSYK
jgi:PKHD-type hydroxylase